MNNSSTMFHSPKTRRVAQIERLGFFFLRFGLVIAIGWIAAMKVTEYEAKGIEPLIAQSIAELGIQHLDSSPFHGNDRRSGDDNCDPHRSSPLVSKSIRGRERRSDLYVSHYAVFHHYDSRLGTESRRLSCPVGRCRRVPDQRFHIARRFDMDAG